MRYPNAVLL